MKNPREHAQLFGVIQRQIRPQFRLRVNDIVRISGKLCRVIRATESTAVIMMNQPPPEFTTLFDKHVRFQPAPARFRISPNSELEILNRNPREPKKRKYERRMA